jgi:hypothetical protein
MKEAGPGAVGPLLAGIAKVVWLGHPLHPLLVQLPVGTWLSASLLDTWPGNEKASRRLVLAGLAASVPATLAGTADWSEQHEQQMRVGLVHAVANAAAIACYAASATLPTRARILRLAGLAAVGADGYLGGHMAYRQSAGAIRRSQSPTSSSPAGTTSCRLRSSPTARRPGGCSATCPSSRCATATNCTFSLTGAATCPGRSPTASITTAA